ncbi:MAG TPA: NAD(P)-dependent oxidoreductase [Burkholderiales bacterium]
MESIGFIGAGMMGHGICVNLLKAGHAVAVFAHRNRKPIEDLLAKGATEAKTLEALAGGVDVLMLCVNSAQVVEEIVNGPGIKLKQGALVIDVTTSLPEVSRKLAAQLAKRGIDFVDAPVVGGPPHAAQGKLGTLAGGSDTAFARAKPIIERYSSELTRFGGPGAGNAAKLLNNFLTVGTRALVAQAFGAARRHGIDWAALYPMLAKGAGGSRILETMIAPALEGNYRGNQFSIANCLKDMTYAGVMVGDDPDGARLQKDMQAFFQRFADAGFGERMASETLDPVVLAKLGDKGR